MAPVGDLGAHVATGIAALAVADEGASIATVEGIDGRGQADHARPGVRRLPWQDEVNYLFGLEDARALYLVRPHL